MVFPFLLTYINTVTGYDSFVNTYFQKKVKKLKKILAYTIVSLSLTGCVDAQVPTMGHIIIANEFVGSNERTDRNELREFLSVDPVRTEWCAAFVNAVLAKDGIPGSETVSDYPLTARSFLQWGEGVEYPRLGDIVVFPRGNQGWQGHVGFYMETVVVDGIIYYNILGGNQDNTVSYKLYRADLALGIRRHQSLQDEIE
jgi:uncharacterized protein (TIGR02594 family)